MMEDTTLMKLLAPDRARLAARGGSRKEKVEIRLADVMDASEAFIKAMFAFQRVLDQVDLQQKEAKKE